ncbi:flagellar basal body P-ring formation chaperone FlgA [Pseudomonas sp. FME51]|uniref:flagellar basal body P-ring formation chaperone FlgA n=1 Tax=Pseudomonas sp. FME51 TaxID=2742609 RepID=UPI00186852D9|nr:flagellar basal body P-ring formation chaperone FlgA [Pseudomonas sp. FME51]
MQLSALTTRLIALAALLSAGSLSASPLIDQLIGTTTTYLEDKVATHLAGSTRDARFEIKVSRLDPRLRLPLCPPEAIQASLESPDIPVGRVTVRVTCDSDVQWRLFVPATVELYHQVLVTTRPLPRHAVIAAQDITLRERNVGNISGGYLMRPERAIGMRVRRPVAADTVLSPNQLEQDETVKRGDKVVISAANSRVSVRMPGEALESGSTGSQIRVRNLRSDRVVRARIIGPGQVEVAM